MAAALEFVLSNSLTDPLTYSLKPHADLALTLKQVRSGEALRATDARKQLRYIRQSIRNAVQSFGIQSDFVPYVQGAQDTCISRLDVALRTAVCLVKFDGMRCSDTAALIEMQSGPALKLHLLLALQRMDPTQLISTMYITSPSESFTWAHQSRGTKAPLPMAATAIWQQFLPLIVHLKHGIHNLVTAFTHDLSKNSPWHLRDP